MMLLMKFDYDWPTGLRDINVLKCGRTDLNGRTNGRTNGWTDAGLSPIL